MSGAAGARGRGRFQRSLRVDAERRVRSAVGVAVVLGSLSLIAGVQTWRERRYLDQDITLGLVDAVVVLGLAVALQRQRTWAAWALLLLSGAGVIYTLYNGYPWAALLPPVVGGIFYARAIQALRVLRGGAV